MTLTAIATDGGSWKWMKGNANVAGATGTGNTATLNMPSITAAMTGSYKAVFTNAAGTTNSASSTVTVN